jgi:hypothetical protein
MRDGARAGRGDGTDAGGRFRVGGLEPGAHVLELNVQRRGAARRTLRREGFAAGADDVVIVVDEQGLAIEGVLRDADGDPLGGVEIGVGSSRCLTDARGRFVVDGLDDGTYDVRLRDERYVGFLLDGARRLRAGARDVAITLRRGVATRGVVVDAGGRPLGRLRLVFVADGSSAWADTDDAGAFEVALLDAEYRVTGSRREDGATRTYRLETLHGAGATAARLVGNPE